MIKQKIELILVNTLSISSITLAVKDINELLTMLVLLTAIIYNVIKIGKSKK